MQHNATISSRTLCKKSAESSFNEALIMNDISQVTLQSCRLFRITSSFILFHNRLSNLSMPVHNRMLISKSRAKKIVKLGNEASPFGTDSLSQNDTLHNYLESGLKSVCRSHAAHPLGKTREGPFVTVPSPLSEPLCAFSFYSFLLQCRHCQRNSKTYELSASTSKPKKKKSFWNKGKIW